MNFAVGALGIGDHIGGEVGDPVCDVAGSSEGKDNAVDGCRVACEPLEVTSFVVVGFDMFHFVGLAVVAGPCVDGVDGLVGDGGHVGELFGNFGLKGKSEYEK